MKKEEFTSSFTILFTIKVKFYKQIKSKSLEYFRFNCKKLSVQLVASNPITEKFSFTRYAREDPSYSLSTTFNVMISNFQLRHAFGSRSALHGSFGKLYDRVSWSDYEKSREGNGCLYTMRDVRVSRKQRNKSETCDLLHQIDCSKYVKNRGFQVFEEILL